MLTRDEIDHLTPAERTELLRELLQAVYPGASQPAVCHELDIAPVTLRRWMREDTVPAWPLMLLGMLADDRSATIVKDLRAIARRINRL